MLLALLGPAGAAPEAADAPIVVSRVEIGADGATVTLRLDRAVEPSAAGLDDPPRLLVDLPLAEWRAAPAAPQAAGLARGLRWGLARPGVSRLVVDLGAPAHLAASRVTPEGDGALLTLRLAPGWASAPPPTEGPARPVVALDPGHGGLDPGAVRDGLVEKALTLAFARDLAPLLEAKGFAVVLTREGDETVGLASRLARARAAGAAALLSLHADAAPQPHVAGVSVYTLSARASDAMAAALAAGAAPEAVVGPGAFAGAESDLVAALTGLARRDNAAASARLGAELLAALGARTPTLPGRPLRAAAFRVLAAPDLPAALIELGFLSNAGDRERLADPAWRTDAAAAVAQGVARWFSAQ